MYDSAHSTRAPFLPRLSECQPSALVVLASLGTCLDCGVSAADPILIGSNRQGRCAGCDEHYLNTGVRRRRRGCVSLGTDMTRIGEPTDGAELLAPPILERAVAWWSVVTSEWMADFTFDSGPDTRTTLPVVDGWSQDFEVLHELRGLAYRWPHLERVRFEVRSPTLRRGEEE